MMVREELLQVLRYKDLLINLVLRNLTVRYKRSVLGLLWTMINPLINTVVFTIVFSTIFRFSTRDFIIYFLSGHQLWGLFYQTTTLSSRCFLSNGQLLKKVYLPKAILVLSILFSELVNFFFSLLPLLLLMVIIGNGISFALFFLPVSLLFMILFTMGISLFLAVVCVYFVDIMETYQLLVIPWMYLTPIFYPVDIVPQRFLFIIKMNPMYYLIECFRTPIYLGHLPEPLTIFWAACSAIIVFLAGFFSFTKLSDNIIYYI